MLTHMYNAFESYSSLSPLLFPDNLCSSCLLNQPPLCFHVLSSVTRWFSLGSFSSVTTSTMTTPLKKTSLPAQGAGPVSPSALCDRMLKGTCPCLVLSRSCEGNYGCFEFERVVLTSHPEARVLHLFLFLWLSHSLCRFFCSVGGVMYVSIFDCALNSIDYLVSGRVWVSAVTTPLAQRLPLAELRTILIHGHKNSCSGCNVMNLPCPLSKTAAVTSALGPSAPSPSMDFWLDLQW